jgi:hypothetical protein
MWNQTKKKRRKAAFDSDVKPPLTTGPYDPNNGRFVPAEGLDDWMLKNSRSQDRRHGPEMPFLTPAQETMRRDIESVHNTPYPLDDPKRIGDVLNDELGELGIPDELWVTQKALQVIGQHKELVLSIKDWLIVQAMVEDGVRAGYHQAAG